jgi:hypothetical protein
LPSVLLPAVAFLGWYIATFPDPFHRLPGPVRVLKRNRARIEAYLESMDAGRIPLRKDGRGDCLLDVLAEADATSVHIEDGCVVITFATAFMADESVPILVHCPSGMAGLPERYWPGWKPTPDFPSPCVSGFKKQLAARVGVWTAGLCPRWTFGCRRSGRGREAGYRPRTASRAKHPR